MGYMLACHLHRMYHMETTDITGAQMVATLKYVSIAFCIRDGQKFSHSNYKDKENLTSEELEVLNDQKVRAITKVPNLLEYFGYIFFIPSLLVGPYLDYKEYDRFIDRSMFKDEYCKGEIPNSLIPSVIEFFKAIFFALLLAAQALLPESTIYTQPFADWPFILRLLSVILFGFWGRCRYYLVWSLSNSAYILCGSGYNGIIEKKDLPKWDRFKNTLPSKLELMENVRALTTNWNMRSAFWLKSYVYVRIPKFKNKILRALFEPTFTTFIVSALWHGLFPGYYVIFITLGIETIVGRLCRRKLRWRVLGNKTLKLIYDIVGVFISLIAVNYAALAFICLYPQNLLFYYSHLYYSVHIIAFIMWFALSFFPNSPEEQKKEDKN